MSPQRENESQPEYIRRLERIQRNQEKRLRTVEVVASEAMEMAVDTNALVLSMPQKVIEAIDAREITRKKEQKLDSREKLFLAMGALGALGGLASAIASIKQAFGG